MSLDAVVVESEDEARLYAERRCFICADWCGYWLGVRCRVSSEFYFLLCDECWRCVRIIYKSGARRHPDRFIPALRSMRERRP